MCISYDSAISLLGYIPRKMSFYVLRNKKYTRHGLDMYKNANSNIYNSAKWKQPHCLSIEEWINKLWYVFTIEHYIAMKRMTSATCHHMINLTHRVLNTIYYLK